MVAYRFELIQNFLFLAQQTWTRGTRRAFPAKLNSTSHPSRARQTRVKKKTLGNKSNTNCSWSFAVADKSGKSFVYGGPEKCSCPGICFSFAAFSSLSKTQEKEANSSCSNARRASCRCWLRLISLQLYLASVSASIENCFFGEASGIFFIRTNRKSPSRVLPPCFFSLLSAWPTPKKLGQICSERRVGGTHTKTRRKKNGKETKRQSIDDDDDREVD